MKLPLVLFAAATLLLQSGCVTGRRELTLNVPTSSPVAVSKGKIYLSAVTDDRGFQNKPSDPSTPSIDGDVNAVSAAQKDRMIGRQRNTYGHAMGDIALSNNDTVTQRVRLLVTEGFHRAGYEVVTDPAGATPVTVSVEKFWAWMTPGFWTLSFEARIATQVTVKSPAATQKFTVLAYGINHGQIAKDGNWQEVFVPTFEDYLTNFKHEVEKLDLH